MKVAAQCSKLGYTVAPMEQRAELVVGRALVVVVDDRTAHGDEDHSGPLVTELLTEAGFVVDGVVAVSADEVEIRNALNTAVIGGVDLVVSVGGKPPATFWTARSSVSPRPSARPGCPRESSTPGCRAAWRVSPAARWWSTSRVRVMRCAMEWRR